MLERWLALWVFLPPKYDTQVREAWLWEFQRWPPPGLLRRGQEANSQETALYQSPETSSGRITYLLTAGLQYLAQCLVGRKCLITNEYMAALLAWCSTLFFHQKNKTANLILVNPPGQRFFCPWQKWRQDENALNLQVFCFLKSQKDHYPLHLPFNTVIHCKFSLVLFLRS